MSKLESIMQAIVAKAVAINDGATPTPNTIFKYVSRQVLIGQNLQQSQKPALGVQRLIDRNDRKHDSLNAQVTQLAFQFQVIGKETDKEAIDTELTMLKDYLNQAFLNTTLGGLVANITYYGAYSSNFVAMPQGSELVRYLTVMVEAKPSNS